MKLNDPSEIGNPVLRKQLEDKLAAEGDQQHHLVKQFPSLATRPEIHQDLEELELMEFVAQAFGSYVSITPVKIVPVPKPRMTRKDRFVSRRATEKYWDFKDKLRFALKGYDVPLSHIHLIFFIPMPVSWTKKKKLELNLKPHQQRPDRDNYDKAFWDAMFKEDKEAWDARVSKLWYKKGYILLREFRDY